MTSTVGARPPRAAVSLIDLFASPGAAEAILGDLHEEFSVVVGRTGESAARHWYWRQCGRTLGHFVTGPFRTSPWATVGVTLAGFALSLLMRRATGEVVAAPIFAQLGLDYFFLFFVATNVLAQFLTGATIGCVARRGPMGIALSVVFTTGVLMAVTEPIVYLPARLGFVGGPIMLGAALASRRLRKDYEGTPALGR